MSLPEMQDAVDGAHVTQEDAIARECQSFSDNTVLETVFERSGSGFLAGNSFRCTSAVEVQASEK